MHPCNFEPLAVHRQLDLGTTGPNFLGGASLGISAVNALLGSNMCELMLAWTCAAGPQVIMLFIFCGVLFHMPVTCLRVCARAVLHVTVFVKVRGWAV